MSYIVPSLSHTHLSTTMWWKFGNCVQLQQHPNSWDAFRTQYYDWVNMWSETIANCWVSSTALHCIHILWPKSFGVHEKAIEKMQPREYTENTSTRIRILRFRHQYSDSVYTFWTNQRVGVEKFIHCQFHIEFPKKTLKSKFIWNAISNLIKHLWITKSPNSIHILATWPWALAREDRLFPEWD